MQDFASRFYKSHCSCNVNSLLSAYELYEDSSHLQTSTVKLLLRGNPWEILVSNTWPSIERKGIKVVGLFHNWWLHCQKSLTYYPGGGFLNRSLIMHSIPCGMWVLIPLCWRTQDSLPTALMWSLRDGPLMIWGGLGQRIRVEFFFSWQLAVELFFPGQLAV